MAPVHAHEMDRAVGRVASEVVEGLRKPVNSDFVISPDAIANSRCLIEPLPPT
jgi:hypothetical protein